MGEAKRRKEALIRALEVTAGVSREEAERMYERQIVPQDRVRELQQQGHDIDVGLVNVSPDAKGYTITCLGCGRTGRMPRKPPVSTALCPDCAKERL